MNRFENSSVLDGPCMSHGGNSRGSLAFSSTVRSIAYFSFTLGEKTPSFTMMSGCFKTLTVGPAQGGSASMIKKFVSVTIITYRLQLHCNGFTMPIVILGHLHFHVQRCRHRV